MHSKASLALGFGIMGLSAWAVISAMHWPWKAALFPLVIGIPVFCLAAAEVLWGLFGRAADRATDVSEPLVQSPVQRRGVLKAIGWILGLFAAIALLGFPIAVPLFVFVYVKLQGREGWMMSVVFTLIVSAIFYGIFDRLLHLPFPDGWMLVWAGVT